MNRIWQSSQKYWHTHKTLSLLVGFSLGCLAVSLIGLFFDARHINGEQAWIKPCKFSLSLAVYGATLIWLSQYIIGRKMIVQASFAAACAGTVVELSAIILQVVRGTTSHFNTSTPFDLAVFWIITAAIVPVSLALVAVYAVLLNERDLPPVIGLALKWGLFLTIVGLLPGVLMILPDPAQNMILACKRLDGHTVGYPEGGPGLPWLGWSTVAGDLRVAHFAGIHAMQVLPIIGFVVTQAFRRLSIERQQSLIWNAGLSYLGFLCLLVWQAVSAESIVSPSYRTLFFGSTIVAASSFWTIHILLPKRLIELRQS